MAMVVSPNKSTDSDKNQDQHIYPECGICEIYTTFSDASLVNDDHQSNHLGNYQGDQPPKSSGGKKPSNLTGMGGLVVSFQVAFSGNCAEIITPSITLRHIFIGAHPQAKDSAVIEAQGVRKALTFVPPNVPVVIHGDHAGLIKAIQDRFPPPSQNHNNADFYERLGRIEESLRDKASHIACHVGNKYDHNHNPLLDACHHLSQVRSRGGHLRYSDLEIPLFGEENVAGNLYKELREFLPKTRQISKKAINKMKHDVKRGIMRRIEVYESQKQEVLNDFMEEYRQANSYKQLFLDSVLDVDEADRNMLGRKKYLLKQLSLNDSDVTTDIMDGVIAGYAKRHGKYHFSLPDGDLNRLSILPKKSGDRQRSLEKVYHAILQAGPQDIIRTTAQDLAQHGYEVSLAANSPRL